MSIVKMSPDTVIYLGGNVQDKDQEFKAFMLSWAEKFMDRYFPEQSRELSSEDYYCLNDREMIEWQRRVERGDLSAKDGVLCTVRDELFTDSPELMSYALTNNLTPIQYNSPNRSLYLINILDTFSRISSERQAHQDYSYLEQNRKKYANKADQKALNLKPVLEKINPEGKLSLAAIAKELTEMKIPTPTNKKEWSAMTVKRVQDRLKKLGYDPSP